MNMGAEIILLDGQNLSISDLVLLGKGQHKIKLRSQAEAKVEFGRNLVGSLQKEKKVFIIINFILIYNYVVPGNT